MKLGANSNVLNLRRRDDRPYDHQAEDEIPVQMSTLAWSLVAVQLRNSNIQAVRDAGDEIARQVRTQQSMRLHPSNDQGSAS